MVKASVCKTDIIGSNPIKCSKGAYMRLWHKNLICCLPRQQLLSQWRELKCIVKYNKEKGTPNHILVNKYFRP